MAINNPFPMPRPTTNEESYMGITLDDLKGRMGYEEPSSGGLLSNIRSGLLSAGQAVGRGVGQAAGLLGESVREPLARGVADIPDVMRFYEAQRMSQPMMAYDPADLKPVSPAGVVGMLPQLRAAEQTAMQKPELDQMKAMADLARARGASKRGAGIVSAKTYRLPDGKIVETFADKETLERVYLDEQGNRRRVPQGAIAFSDADVQSSKYFETKSAEIKDDERRIKALDSYLNTVEGAEQGFKRFFDKVSLSIKTFIDAGKISEEELKTAAGQAKLQGLLGMLREEIVGGGVMTEFDAVRVLRALGGDFNAFQNPEAVRRAITDLRSQVVPRYQSNIERYNAQLQQLPAGSATINVYKPIEAMSFSKSSNDTTPTPTPVNDPLGLRQQ